MIDLTDLNANFFPIIFDSRKPCDPTWAIIHLPISE